MKCPICKKEGLKSKVFPGTQVTTLMGGQTYYDEDGNWHDHDPNKTTISYWCTKNHRWAVSSYSKCPSCDYSLEDTIHITE